jgi:hypothetical protein
MPTLKFMKNNVATQHYVDYDALHKRHKLED